MPPRTGVHSIRERALSAFARSAATTADLPSANCPAGVGIITSAANIGDRPAITSVLALAAEKARSAASSSSTADCGVAARQMTGMAMASVINASRTRRVVWRIISIQFARDGKTVTKKAGQLVTPWTNTDCPSTRVTVPTMPSQDAVRPLPDGLTTSPTKNM